MVFKQTRVTIRIDFHMRELIAQLHVLKPGRKISQLMRSALRQYLDKIVKEAMSDDAPEPSGPIAASYAESLADRNKAKAEFAAADKVAIKPRKKARA